MKLLELQLTSWKLTGFMVIFSLHLGYFSLLGNYVNLSVFRTGVDFTNQAIIKEDFKKLRMAFLNSVRKLLVLVFLFWKGQIMLKLK